MATSKVRFVAAALVGAFAALHAASARAETQYGLTAGYGHSDNVFRRADDEITSDILTAGVELRWDEDRPRFDAEVRADLDFNHYINVDDNFDVDDQVTGNANAQLNFSIIPERFTWVLDDTFGQTQQDPLVPATPESLESTNYLTTGPDLIFLMGSTNALRFYGRYSLTTYELSPFNNTRAGGGVSFQRQVSERSSLALTVDSDDIDYEDEGNVDFLRNSASVTYALDAARTDIDAEVGYTQMDLDDGSEQSGPLVDIEVRRQISNSSLLNLHFGTQLSDAAEALRSAIDSEDFGNDGSGVIATASVFENQFVSLAWEFDRPRTSFEVSAGYDKDVYESGTDLDRERLLFEAGAERHLNNRLSLRARASYNEESYESDGSEIEELRFILGGSYRFGPDTGMELWGERLKRDSNTTAGGGHSVENRIFLTFFYRPAAR